jgi:Outer membrane protein beta-barrel domain
LEDLVTGHLRVYAAEDQQQEPVFFVQKGNEEVVPLHPKYYPGLLSTLGADCPNFMRNARGETVDPYAYNRSALVRMAMDYNRCAHPETVSTVKNTKSKIKLSFGVLGGLNMVLLVPQKQPEDGWIRNRKNALGYSLGAFANLGYAGPLSLQTELLLTSRGGSYGDVNLDAFFYPDSVALVGPTVTMLNLPVLLRFDFLRKSSIRPYLMTGPSLTLRYFGGDATLQQRVRSGVVSQPLSVKMGSAEFLGAAGVEFSRQSMKIFVEMRYSTWVDTPEVGATETSLSYRTFQFLLGCRF